jgi:hypothetical protein
LKKFHDDTINPKRSSMAINLALSKRFSLASKIDPEAFQAK